MNKNNDAMICINDLYFEDTENIRKLSEYILQLERQKFFYESGYRKVLMINENLKRKNKKLHTKCHVYKVELNRCQRKLGRIYKEIYDYVNYFFDYNKYISAELVIDIFKKL